ncbi:MAG: ACT domain-containing protein [Clostridia bacterium]|nr:ACT domain-containing protein [Clostridia bacterium]MBR2302999.1 ACT domain-containing protein [Clostridia bacterium]
MKAIISVIGEDRPGIIAKVSSKLFEMNVNIEDISQTIMQNYFTMIMMVDTSKSSADFATISQAMVQLGQEIGMDIKMQNQSIFDAMHRV